ncbi:hypothetical protein Q604_UNBC13269G0001, partial [human gut metagenome]
NIIVERVAAPAVVFVRKRERVHELANWLREAGINNCYLEGEMVQGKRNEAYDEAQSILAQELPILPLASSLRLQAYRYDIKGLVLSPFGNASFAGVYREKQDEV